MSKYVFTRSDLLAKKLWQITCDFPELAELLCSADLYFSRLVVTGRGSDICELGKDLNSYPKIMVPSKDWLCKQHLTPWLRPRLVSLCHSSCLLPYFCHKSSLLFGDHLRTSYTIYPVSWWDLSFPFCLPQGGSGADWHPDIASAPKAAERAHCWEVPTAGTGAQREFFSVNLKKIMFFYNFNPA